MKGYILIYSTVWHRGSSSLRLGTHRRKLKKKKKKKMVSGDNDDSDFNDIGGVISKGLECLPTTDTRTVRRQFQTTFSSSSFNFIPPRGCGRGDRGWEGMGVNLTIFHCAMRLMVNSNVSMPDVRRQ